ncbi:aminotransferase class III-fold pyridoxal phosphate-dependent enzyme [Lysobacter sp. TY2-98]|uniref:aminotransferase class III-fold pyridoxal phosphate-dependent enzyme n=1 Tax=Lysobacter sp. TY2-98 TaxID=2290922 RepID=UPI000E1FD061|nr:aminotransferase class III-fold pyridoxal phosphate-dependent enzyme [Lysobacter sp. TY2-98]AXK71522.1 aminotransferase class III-fold pyridoxal phosphate-dependent enzyme [Lysobacter sp. TY2-98]
MSNPAPNAVALLAPLRARGGTRRTVGLDDATIERFAASHPDLREALEAAAREFDAVKADAADLLDLDEDAQIHAVQAGYVNFYPDDAVNPYVALVARGPWVVTLKGAVLHDSGGYGMLGFGHAPQAVIDAMAKPQVMANIMTPSLAQRRFDRAIRGVIGLANGCPYERFFCLNSGSESVSLASRIADANAKLMTDPGARHAGRTIKRLVVKGSFHGRTERPALYSDSSRKTYVQHLASFRGEDSVITVEPYDVDALRRAFADADANDWFIEAMFLEPVMGEGDPGRSVPRAFYDAARELTKSHGGLLLVDSIQAGLRANGVLSIIDYPGFESIDPPDMETYSKALNAGQYPLSVLAVNGRAAGLYRKGLYGNTMTTNPRALDVACAVIDQVTPAVRENIRARGTEALQRLEALKSELGGLITKVQGTGLLFSCELSPKFKCYGAGSTEEWLRERGIGVIHGGANSLRFTPTFTITSEELEMVVAMVARALKEGPRIEQAAAA